MLTRVRAVTVPGGPSLGSQRVFNPHEFMALDHYSPSTRVFFHSVTTQYSEPSVHPALCLPGEPSLPLGTPVLSPSTWGCSPVSAFVYVHDLLCGLDIPRAGPWPQPLLADLVETIQAIRHLRASLCCSQHSLFRNGCSRPGARAGGLCEHRDSTP